MAGSSSDGEVSRILQKRKQLSGSPSSAAVASFSPNGAGSSIGKKPQQETVAEEKYANKQANMKPENPVLEKVDREEVQVEEDEVEREGESEEESEEVCRDVDPLNGVQSRVWMEDTDILDCSTCYRALRPPVYECSNGHVVCISCRLLRGKCSFCSESMVLTRCLVLERVIKSAKIQCPNARYGCHANLSYSHRADHQKSCIYTQCSCPVSSCKYRGSSALLSQHFVDSHKNSAIKFSYGHWFKASVGKAGPFIILISEDSRLFLLLINDVVSGGTTFSVICISPTPQDHEIVYQLSVAHYKGDLKLKAPAKMTSEWKGDYPEVFLFVPDAVCSDKLKLIVSIQKVKQ